MQLSELAEILSNHDNDSSCLYLDDWSIFEYRIIPSYNFYQQLLQHREWIEVISPEKVRVEIKGILKTLCESYS